MKLPSLSLPWAILSSVVIVVLGGLLYAHVVAWPTLAAFIGGVLVPALRSSEAEKAPAVPPLPVLFFVVCFTCALGFLVVACAPSQVAKDEYSAQKHACLDTSVSREQLFACWDDVDKKWNEAGAPPAAILDGGAQ